MAIHPMIPSLTATININSVPLPEYLDPNGPNPASSSSPPSSPSTTTSSPPPANTKKDYEVYVESVPDQVFTITYSIAPEFQLTSQSLGVVVWVDNQVVRRDIISRDKLKVQQGKVFLVEGARGALGQIMEMKFVGIESSDNDELKDNVEQDKEKMKSVGVVVVEFWRVGSIATPRSGLSALSVELEKIDVVHEKVTKGEAKYHTVALGDVKAVKYPLMKRAGPRLDAAPFASFSFLYRSKLALRQLRVVIEPTPEPEPVSEPDYTTMTKEQLIDMLKSREPKPLSIPIKQELKREYVPEELYDAEEGPRKKVKQEKGTGATTCDAIEIDDD